MRLERAATCDVLVLGCGLAGLTAALAAARAGRDVIIACAGPRFSGSSFYPGTWGLGLVGPQDAGDVDDLARTIEDVGCGVADPVLAQTLAAGIGPAIERLRAMGVRLREAERTDEREFIPCFDHKHRSWHGIEAPSAREAYGRELEPLGVRVLPRVGAVRLARDAGGRVCGAVLADTGGVRAGAGATELAYVASRSTVLATGGFGGLFSHRLCTPDVAGVGQGLALEVGCELVNMEFLQMMPGYVAPGRARQTVFNEKTFRWVRLVRADGSALLGEDPARVQELLDMRSGYGPFTSRLASREVDIALYQAFVTDERGVGVSYAPALFERMPEFVRTYFDWLREAKGLVPTDPVRIGVFAHAANGGVRITADGATCVDGLFAAGEATGGMHGADRLGGLSTANCLVFGERAGASAATACEAAGALPSSCELETHVAPVPDGALETLRHALFSHAMVVRDEAGLAQALDVIEGLRERLDPDRAGEVAREPRAVAEALRLSAQLSCARALVRAASERRESRGSHYRADHPVENPARAVPSVIRP